MHAGLEKQKKQPLNKPPPAPVGKSSMAQPLPMSQGAAKLVGQQLASSMDALQQAHQEAEEGGGETAGWVAGCTALSSA